MILVIGKANDDHVRYVTKKLAERGRPFFEFDPTQYPTSAEITAEYDRSGKAARRLAYLGAGLDLESVRAVWHRARERPLPHAEVKAEHAWWVAESCARFLSQLYECLDCPWVPERPASEFEPFRQAASPPNPWPDWHAPPVRLKVPSSENKLHQLSVAGRLGFTVPRTLVTNDIERFLEFYESCDGRLISKRAVALPPLAGDDTAKSYTTLVTRRDVANSRALTYGPVVFQEYVPKSLELRITVVGKKLFAAAIRSQDSFRQSTDWRHHPQYGQAQFYVEHSLPDKIRDRCIQLTEALGLNFGAIDLILTPDGDYVFLELNMNGQWAYIEDILGFPISEAIAELLIQSSVG